MNWTVHYWSIGSLDESLLAIFRSCFQTEESFYGKSELHCDTSRRLLEKS